MGCAAKHCYSNTETDVPRLMALWHEASYFGRLDLIWSLQRRGSLEISADVGEGFLSWLDQSWARDSGNYATLKELKAAAGASEPVDNSANIERAMRTVKKSKAFARVKVDVEELRNLLAKSAVAT